MAVYPECAKCPGAYCQSAPMEKIKKEALPEYCPIKTSGKVIRSIVKRYGQDDVKKTYIPATITEKETYKTIRGVRMAVRPRIW